MNDLRGDISIPNDWDRRGLPGWCYHSDALLELEKQFVFREHWQIACHVSDVPGAGDYLTLDLVGERVLILRDQAGTVKAFHNICRHRGSRVAPAERGNCRNSLACPFHGWVYNLDGTLRGPARPRTFPPLDPQSFGLVPIELEFWAGFAFIRLRPGPQPAVAEVMAPFAAEIASYRPQDMVPAAGMWTQVTPVNWKSVRDVDNEGYHVAMAHPSLQDLYGQSYRDEPFVKGLSRSFATYNGHGGHLWSVRNYLKLSPAALHLPESHRRAWLYFALFPNAVIALTPQGMQFYQEFPLSKGQTLLRGGVYRYPKESRAQRIARYLASRIDRQTQSEDVQLTIWSNEAMTSGAFAGFYLSDLEYGVRTHHDHLRAVLPVMTLDAAPDEREMARENERLKDRPPVS